MSDEYLDIPVHRGPERRKDCDGCEEMIKLRLRVAKAKGGQIVMFGLVSVLVILSYLGYDKAGKLSESVGPELAIASRVARDVESLQEDNRATSSAVIILTEQMKHYTVQTQRLSESINNLAERIKK